MENCAKPWEQGDKAAAPRIYAAAGYSINAAKGMAEVQACSACAGDYEDPDRSAWNDDDEDEDSESSVRKNAKEFPAEE